MFEKFADYWNKDNIFIDRVVFLPIVDSTVRLANLKSGGLDLIERLLATDIKDVRADPKLKLSTALELGYQGITINIGKDKAKGPLSQSAKVRQALDLAIDREAINQVVYNGEFVPGNQWVNPGTSLLPEGLSGPRARRRQGQGAAEGGRHRRGRLRVDFMVPKNAESEAVAQVIQSMAAEAGFDLKIRVTELATSLKQAEAGEYQAFILDWSGRIDPDGNSYIFLQDQGAAELQRLFQSGGRQGARRRAPRDRHGAAQGDLREDDQIDPRGRADHLYLPSQEPDRPHRQARRLQGGPGRAGARGRAEVRSEDDDQLRTATVADAELPRQAPAAADPDAVLRVGPDLFAAASSCPAIPRW